MRFLISILIVFCFSSGGISQQNYLKGTSFWLGFMGNMEPQNESVVAITSDNGANGTIEIPLSGWSSSFNVSANGSIEIILPTSLTQIDQSGTFPYGVKITSDNSISVYAINRTDASDDATMVKPEGALGYKYYAATWLEPAPRNDVPEFIIVATHDNTDLLLTSPTGITSSVSLDAGELHQVQSTNELSGTLIEVICNSAGEKFPVAVFSGTRATCVGGVGARDHLYTQVYPVDTWGTSFNLFPLPYSNSYFINIIASQNNTIVTLNGSNITLNMGNYYRTDHLGAAYISSNQPISVQLIKKSADYYQGNQDGDPLMLNISPDDQGVTEARFYSFDISASFVYPQTIQVYTATSNTNNIVLDGTAVSGWNVNPQNTTFSIAEVLLPQGNTDHKLSSSGATFIATASAQLHARSYGYTIGFNTPFYEPDFEIGYLTDTLNYQIFSDTICSCEPVYFEAEYPIGTVDFLWEFGDGTTASGNPVTHSYANGSYEVILNILDPSGCKIDTLIKHHLFVKNCDIEMSPLLTLCPGNPVTLTSLAGTQFLWSTGATSQSIVVAPLQTTTYYLSVDGGTLPICDSITVFVHLLQSLNLTDIVDICNDDNYIIDPGITGDYLWSTNEVTNSIIVNQPGLYWVEIADSNSCLLSDSLTLVVHTPPSWWLEDDYLFCSGDALPISAQGNLSGAESYLWSNQNTSPITSVEDPGIIWLEVDDGFCVTSDTALANEVNQPIITVSEKIVLCATQYTIDLSQDYTNYYWSTGDTTSTLSVTESGSVEVEVMNLCGSITDSIEVVFDCTFSFYCPNSFTPNMDGINDTFSGKGVGIDSYKLMIFNRWGELIFETDNIESNWNGTYKNEPAPQDVYVYRVTIRDVLMKHHHYTGHVSLLR